MQHNPSEASQGQGSHYPVPRVTARIGMLFFMALPDGQAVRFPAGRLSDLLRAATGGKVFRADALPLYLHTGGMPAIARIRMVAERPDGNNGDRFPVVGDGKLRLCSKLQGMQAVQSIHLLVTDLLLVLPLRVAGFPAGA